MLLKMERSPLLKATYREPPKPPPVIEEVEEKPEKIEQKPPSRFNPQR